MQINHDVILLKPTYQNQQITGLSGAGSYNTDPIDASQYTELLAYIKMTAQSGTAPTLDCKLQYSPNYNPSDQSGDWYDSGDSFTQMTTTTGNFIKKLSSNFGKYVRLVFTLGGTTPNYTFTTAITAKQ